MKINSRSHLLSPFTYKGKKLTNNQKIIAISTAVLLAPFPIAAGLAFYGITYGFKQKHIKAERAAQDVLNHNKLANFHSNIREKLSQITEEVELLKEIILHAKEPKVDLAKFLSFLHEEHIEDFNQIAEIALNHKEAFPEITSNLTLNQLSDLIKDKPTAFKLVIQDRVLILDSSLIDNEFLNKALEFEKLKSSEGELVMELKDFTPESFINILEHTILNKPLSIDKSNVAEYAYIADYIGLNNVKDECENWLLSQNLSYKDATLIQLLETFSFDKVKISIAKQILKKHEGKKNISRKDLTILEKVLPYNTSLSLTGATHPKKIIDLLEKRNIETTIIIKSVSDLRKISKKSIPQNVKICIDFSGRNSFFIKDSDLKYAASMPISSLNLSGCNKITDAGLSYLKGSKLTYLNLKGCHIGDAGLANFKGSKLTHLNLAGCDGITNDGLHNFQGSLLTYLSVSGRGITDIGLGNFKDSKLRFLSLHFCKITDNGLSNFIDSKLDHLDLYGCSSITNAGLDNFSGSLLTHLNLSLCRNITDLGLANFEGSQLKFLNLGFNSNVTDTGLDNFKGSKLNTLEISGCLNITNKGLDNFKNSKLIERLIITNSPQITDAGLLNFQGSKPFCYIDNPHITKVGLAYVGVKR